MFVLDAFGAAHRAHASIAGVAEHIQSAAGPLLTAELTALHALVDTPPRPLTVVLGGSKVSDKLAVIHALLPIVDSMLVGGGMCFTLLAAEGFEIGSSIVERDQIDSLEEVLASDYGDRIVLPVDLVVADRFAEDAQNQIVGIGDVDDHWMGLDIGPRTAEQFAAAIMGSGSVFWNGPMGVFEWPAFRAGTAVVAQAVADTDAFTVAGGGDSVAALRLLGLESALDICRQAGERDSNFSRASGYRVWWRWKGGFHEPQTAHGWQLEDERLAPRCDPDGAEGSAIDSIPGITTA